MAVGSCLVYLPSSSGVNFPVPRNDALDTTAPTNFLPASLADGAVPVASANLQRDLNVLTRSSSARRGRVTE